MPHCCHGVNIELRCGVLRICLFTNGSLPCTTADGKAQVIQGPQDVIIVYLRYTYVSNGFVSGLKLFASTYAVVVVTLQTEISFGQVP